MKGLEVSSCFNCPICTTSAGFGIKCSLANRYLHEANIKKVIPQWCPLPDVRVQASEGEATICGTAECSFARCTCKTDCNRKEAHPSADNQKEVRDVRKR